MPAEKGQEPFEIRIIDPTEFPDWDALLVRSGDASFFHTAAWARVLKTSYHYRPVYFTAFDGDKLAGLIPFMEVRSFVTGVRGVALPYTDQCPPFASSPDLLRETVARAMDHGHRSGWRYLEWRDAGYFGAEVPPSEVYTTHKVDLAKTEDELFVSFKEGNRRNIRKAGREGVTVSVSRSREAMAAFRGLNDITRKRHGLPPQPRLFFEHVFTEIMAGDMGIVVSAHHDGRLLAASVFFHFGKDALYKYGASDLAYQSLRPNNLVMWEAMKWYRDRGFTTLNLGRTESDNPGLLQFKRLWNPRESVLPYYRFDLAKGEFIRDVRRTGTLQTRLMARTPLGLLRLAGRVLYRHFG